MLPVRSRAPRRLPAHSPDHLATSDDDLARIALRDPEAFGVLYDRYAERIYGYCFLRLRHPEAAEDVTSQVFLKALAGLKTYHGGHFAAWLFRIAHNVIITTVERDRPHRPLETGDEPPDPATGPSELTMMRAEADALYDALARLPVDQRRVLELQLAGWSGVQIAAVLGRSVSAVKMLRYRAVQRLRVVLDEKATARQEETHGSR